MATALNCWLRDSDPYAFDPTSPHLWPLLGERWSLEGSHLFCGALVYWQPQTKAVVSRKVEKVGGGVVLQTFMILKSIKTQLSKHILRNIRAVRYSEGLPRWLGGKESAFQSRRPGKCRFNPWVGRSPREGNGNPLQYSCLENPMDKGDGQGTVHGDAKSWKKI